MKLFKPLTAVGCILGVLCVAGPVDGSRRARTRVARQSSESWDDWMAWLDDSLDTWTPLTMTPNPWTNWEEWNTWLNDWDTSNTWNYWQSSSADFHKTATVAIALGVGIPLFLIVLGAAITVGCVIAQRRQAQRRSIANRAGVVQQNTIMHPPGSYPQQVYSVPHNTLYPAQDIGMTSSGYVTGGLPSTHIHLQHAECQQPPSYQQVTSPGGQAQAGVESIK